MLGSFDGGEVPGSSPGMTKLTSSGDYGTDKLRDDGTDDGSELMTTQGSEAWRLATGV